MLRTQKQRCKQPVIAFLINDKQLLPKSRSRNRQVMEYYSKRKQKVVQVKSDNHHNRRMIEQKKLRSLNLHSKKQIRVQQCLDEYQLGKPHLKQLRDKQQLNVQDKYNQCLRDDRSSSNTSQILSHYRQSKSRYKNGKEKARKLIQKMLNSSKSNSQQISNQPKQKMQAVKSQQSNKNSPSEEYCMNDIPLKKYSSASSAGVFRPKIQKCSTLKLACRQGTHFSTRHNVGALSSRKSQDISKHQTNESSSMKIQVKQEEGRKIQKLLTEQKQTRTISKKQAPSINQNPLVLQGKHLFTQCGVNEHQKSSTQKSIKDETQHACRQVSRQMPVSRKQTQKIIIRARQKNKKIIGKLKEMKEKRSQLRNSQQFKKDLGKNVSRFSKLAGYAFRQSLRNSLINTRLDQSRCKFMQQSGQNFLSLNSNVHSNSAIVLNEQVRQKILIHLQTIKTIADYAQSFANIYQDCNQWQDLIFLLYKKYYIERFKIYNIMKNGFTKFKDGSINKQSPFLFDFCPVSGQQIQVFRQSKEQVSLQLQVQSSNYEIKTSLRVLYNKFIEKTSQNPSINMYEVDDFTQQILQDLNEEINMLIQSCGKSKKIKIRINQAIQVGLMIAQLEGLALDNIQQIVLGEVQSRDYFDKFYPKFMQIFQDEQKDR